MRCIPGPESNFLCKLRHTGKLPFRSKQFLLELSVRQSLTHFVPRLAILLFLLHVPPLRARNVRFPWKPEASARFLDMSLLRRCPRSRSMARRITALAVTRRPVPATHTPHFPCSYVAGPGPPRWLGTVRTLALHQAHRLTCGAHGGTGTVHHQGTHDTHGTPPPAPCHPESRGCQGLQDAEVSSPTPRQKQTQNHRTDTESRALL